MESAYQTSRTAAPSSPLLLDLRARFLLSQPISQEAADEVSRAVDQLKQLLGDIHPNPYILEAALALALGDVDAASVALERVRPLISAEDDQDSSGTRQNYEALSASLKKAQAR